MRRKLLVFSINETKRNLGLSMMKLDGYEVIFICLKKLEMYDLLSLGVSKEKIYCYPVDKKKFHSNYEDSIVIIQNAITEFNLSNISTSISLNYARNYDPSVPIENLYEEIAFQITWIKEILLNENPDIVVSEFARSLYLITKEICDHYKINFFCPIEHRKSYFGTDLYAFYDKLGNKAGFEQELNSKSLLVFSESEKLFIKNFWDSFYDAKRSTGKKLANYFGGINEFSRKLKFRFKRIPALIKSFNIDRIHYPEKYIFGNQLIFIMRRFLINEIKNRFFLISRKKFFKNKNDIKQDYFYMPLGYYPELVSSLWGNQFYSFFDQEFSVIEQISKNLPVGTCLAIKEHLPMMKNRRLNFYKKVSRLYNVKLMSPYEDTHKLLENSLAAITINGFIGFEAIMTSKPVLAFQGAYYKNLPFVKLIDLNGNLADQLSIDSINNIRLADKDEKNKILAAFYSSSCEISYDKKAGSLAAIINDKDIKKLADFYERFISDSK